MIKICFICHGNICRSPMAEFVLKDMVQKKGVASEFEIISRATSTEEIGNDIHPGTRKVLKKHGIPTFPRMALQLTARDYRQYDYLIAMDHYNLRNIRRIVGGGHPAESVSAPLLCRPQRRYCRPLVHRQF